MKPKPHQYAEWLRKFADGERVQVWRHGVNADYWRDADLSDFIHPGATFTVVASEDRAVFGVHVSGDCISMLRYRNHAEAMRGTNIVGSISVQYDPNTGVVSACATQGAS